MSDDISKADKQTIHRDTMLGRAQADYDLANVGRHAARNITGSWDGPHRYPFLPENSPWSAKHVPDEPALNQDVNAIEPVGEVFEQERSRLAQQQDITIDCSVAGATDAAGSDQPLAASTSSPPPGFEKAEPVLRRLVRKEP